MTVQEFERQVWSFYLRLETEFLNTLMYVEFSQDNYLTYSIEYEKLLLSVGSEIDTVCKLLCKEVDPSQSPAKIYEYANILSDYNDLTTQKVRFQIDMQEYIPFDNWTSEQSPEWWKAYNKVKHERLVNENYKKGNLENVFMALMGLYLLNRYCYKLVNDCSLELEPYPKSQLFSVVGWNVCIPIGNDFYNVLSTNGNIGIQHK